MGQHWRLVAPDACSPRHHLHPYKTPHACDRLHLGIHILGSLDPWPYPLLYHRHVHGSILPCSAVFLVHCTSPQVAVRSKANRLLTLHLFGFHRVGHDSASQRTGLHFAVAIPLHLCHLCLVHRLLFARRQLAQT